MFRYEEEKLLDRVTVLAGEATRLPRSAVGAYRREQIEWELMQLYRRLADVAEREERLHVLSQMWNAIEAHVTDAVVRERIKKDWLKIRSA